jgi:drug/metabolite transporter (DMT)-like permease
MSASAAARALALRGILLSTAGMVIISPDGMLLHMIDTAPAWDVLFWRTFGMGTTLLVLLAAVYRRRLPALLRGQGWPGAACALLMAIANYLFLYAMLHTSVANTLILLATMPFWSALLGRLLIAEAVHPRTLLAIAVAVGGVAVIVSGSADGGTLGGDLAALGAAVCHGLNLVILRKAGDRDMTAGLMGSGFLTAVFCLPFLEPAALSASDWGIVCGLGFGILPVALALFLSGARYAPAAEVALVSLVETVLGPLWAWALLGEDPGPRAVIGGGLVVLAVAGNAVAGLPWRSKGGHHYT